MGTDENMGRWDIRITGYNMGWGTITYINIYFVDITKNCKEKRLKFRDITSKWIFREK